MHSHMKTTTLNCLRKLSFVIFAIIGLGITYHSNAQTSNIATSFNLDKGAIEIAFDLAGPENSLWNVSVALVQKKDSKVIEIPVNNINKSLRGLNPGKHMFEISFADLQIDGDFSTKLDAYGSGTAEVRRKTEAVAPVAAAQSDPQENEPATATEGGEKMYVKKSKKKAVSAPQPEEEASEKVEAPAPILAESPAPSKQRVVAKSVTPESTGNDEYIPENNMPSKGNSNKAIVENKTSNRIIKGFTVKGTSISDLSQKIKQASSELMVLSDLTPVNLNLDLKKLTFKCDFVSNNSNMSKMGLYFGPKSTGCESCINVVINNPGSTVLLKGSNTIFDYELIGIKRN
jgi:hypothetical protein